MKLIPALTNFARNVAELGMNYQDAFTLVAIAELMAEKQHCTSIEVSRLVGKRKHDCYFNRLSQFLNRITGINDRGKITYYHQLNEEGIRVVSRLTSMNSVQLKDGIRHCNKEKKVV